jgi:hypothetical protein
MIQACTGKKDTLADDGTGLNTVAINTIYRFATTMDCYAVINIQAQINYVSIRRVDE